MKKQILISLISLSSILTTNAQWNGTTTTSNVGIGITSPIAKLHIVDNTDNAGLSVQQSGNANSAAAGIYGQYYGLSIGIGNNSQAYYAFNVSSSVTPIGNGFTGGNTLFVVNGDGKTGIGTGSPRCKLHSVSYNNTSTASSYLWGQYYGTYIGIQSIDPNYYAFNVSNNVNEIGAGGNSLFVVKGDGNIGIGTYSPAYKLDVIGTIRAREIKVDLNGADFVFEKDYKLMPLNELEKFVKEQKHLPEIAPAKEMQENGTDLGNLNSKLLQKMEEMTLYMIEQNKKIEALQNEIKEMKAASK